MTTFIETLLVQLQENPLNWFISGFLVYVVYSYFTPPPYNLPIAKHPETTIFREYTPMQLREYDGRTPQTKIYMGVCGKVYDVTRGRNFYGPGIYKCENSTRNNS